MRLAIALIFLIAATSLASAQEDDIPTQARGAYGIFAGGMSQLAFTAAGYGSEALSGLDGIWARLNGPDPKSGAETYGVDREKFCASDLAITLTAVSPLQLRLETTRLKANLVFDYTLVAGATFAEHIDPIPYLSSLGLGPDVATASDAARAVALSYVNSTVQIYRPSPDILVMTRDKMYPVVMARCPA